MKHVDFFVTEGQKKEMYPPHTCFYNETDFANGIYSITEITRAQVNWSESYSVNLFVRFLHETTQLERLIFVTYCINNVPSVLEACALHPSLTHLELRWFGPLRLVLSPRLVELSLTGATIEDADAWVGALSNATCIRKLHFYDCSGAQFWPLLPTCVPNLRTLHMAGRHVDDETAVERMLVLLITSSSSIRELDLKSLSLSARAFGAIIHAFNFSTSLKRVKLSTWAGEIPIANETIISARVTFWNSRLSELKWWLKRNVEFSIQQEKRCRTSLLMLLGMLKHRRADSGLLRTMDRSLMKCVIAPLIWKTRRDVKWRK
jgi:hypothetical protein